MKTVLKIVLVIVVALLSITTVVYAVQVLGITTPASVNVTAPDGAALYDYHGTFPFGGMCNSTVVSSIAFGNMSQGASETVYLCLEDTGGTYYITSGSFATDLSSSTGTIAANYYAINGGGTPLTLPIELTPSEEIVVGYNLTIASGASASLTNFHIMMTMYSTGSG